MKLEDFEWFYEDCHEDCSEHYGYRTVDLAIVRSVDYGCSVDFDGMT